jgi:hypothetical protein
MLKHLALALFLASAALPALAQTSPAPTAAATGQYQYCNLISGGTIGRNASLDYGQHDKHMAANPEMEALNEKVKDLKSVISALNYLTSHGWEYVDVTSSSPGNGATIYYLLRRRTQ